MEIFPPRKRVEAREVDSSAAPAPEPVIERAIAPSEMETPAAPAPRPRSYAEAIVDPTILGERQRKHRHAFLYRWMQLIIAAAYVLVVVSAVFWAMDRELSARALSLSALIVSALAFWLSFLARLVRRLRGYAIAALALSIIALTVNLTVDAKGIIPKGEKSPYHMKYFRWK